MDFFERLDLAKIIVICKSIFQALLAWSEHVAHHDMSFVKGLLYSLMEGQSPGGQEGSNNTRARRSADTQPQNIEEEL